MVESAAYHHKKAVSTTLIIFFKGHYLDDPVDYVDLTAVPLWSRVWWIQAPNLLQQRGKQSSPIWFIFV